MKKAQKASTGFSILNATMIIPDARIYRTGKREYNGTQKGRGNPGRRLRSTGTAPNDRLLAGTHN
ncbi:MAG: hypothetical protein KC643_28050, partial [Nitrospira sp.]|nr:hypothetical protein [Nitrospira sp.]